MGLCVIPDDRDLSLTMESLGGWRGFEFGATGFYVWGCDVDIIFVWVKMFRKLVMNRPFLIESHEGFEHYKNNFLTSLV